MMKVNYKLIAFTSLLVATATLAKLFFSTKLEWSGFSPIIAIALFSGMMLKDKSASFLLPLTSLFISDLIIEVLFKLQLFPFAGLYSYQILNYSLLLFTTLLGWVLKGKSYSSILGGIVMAPTLFFILSNLTVWLSPSQTMYTKDFAGLSTCYVAAMPFYIHSLEATLIFLPEFLFAYNYIVEKKRSLLMA